jgi:serine protease Do/serine protease DegQ
MAGALCAAPIAAQERVVEPLPSLAPLIERVAPAVVNISVSGRLGLGGPLAQDPLSRFFDLPEQREFASAGSGVIVDAERGYLITNYHVIENAEDITITLLDNRVKEATVVGTDAGSDLAVLQIDPDALAQLPFAEPDALSVGDYVVAIGNPFGFSNTVTSGIVSGLGRSGLGGREAYEDFIQTDASINPGNSGGALVDLSGRLVGINSAIISRTGQNIGIGFAIPIDMVRNVMEQLIENGEVSRGLLGVTIVSITPEIAREYGLPAVAGALITEVIPASSAEAAGLRIDDVILTVNDRAIRDSGSLKNSIGLLMPGEAVRVGYIRNGRAQTVTAILNAATPAAVAPLETRAPELDTDLEGAELVAGETANGVEGLRIAAIEDGSPADARGLRVGDVITEINRQRVRTVEDALSIMAEARSVIFRVHRGNRTLLVLLR